ncbi:MAG: caspase family protein [Bacteroidia bacterium]|nr:caspase family protein [Bacteroidia bacterium]MCF8446856.1 caspase family protein [Bacteroidia bacterium]
MTDFVESHKGQTIEEVLFYYTGHGEFYNNEFYYILSDFDQTKRKQTSLQNMEIDNLLRTLTPNLVVKVIDACQSGTSYIKESGAITKYFDDAKQGFKRCYFLNSSLSSQSSFQNNEMSFFTKSFVSAIKENKSDDVRYKSIIDFISDEFENIGDQTPFFVIQADYTEKFCTKNANLKKYLVDFESAKLESTSGTKSSSLLELVQKEANEYITKEKAVELIEKIRIEVGKFKLGDTTKDLYELEATFLEDYKQIPRKIVIGKWLKDNTHPFFAEPTYRKIYENPQDAIKVFATVSILDQFKREKQAEVRIELDGYELKIDVPFKAIAINANSKFPNLYSYNMTVVFLLSKKAIRFFYFISNYNEESWDNRKLLTKDIEWKTIEFKITDTATINDGVKSFFLEFETKIIKDIQGKYKHVSE